MVARTLGVIDDVKASTSDKATIHHTNNAPTIHVQPTSPKTSTADHDIAIEHSDSSLASAPSLTTPSLDPPSYFTSEDHNLTLAGVGVFSPASSRPPSPTISRRQTLHPETKGFTLSEGGDPDGNSYFRKRLGTMTEGNSVN